ncbi:MAG: 2-hydroxyacid dehydrogenase [Burkholderiales bacterium]
MALLFYSKTDAQEPWRLVLAKAFPHLEFRAWPQLGAPEDIRYALVWNPPPGLLATLPNLGAILVLGAGVDALLQDKSLPRHVPILRLVDAGLKDQMTEYGLYGVLHFHRDMPYYQGRQREGQWQPRAAVPATERRVGVMGLGVLGADLARALARMGFQVFGWSRSLHSIEGVTSFQGEHGLREFLAKSDILANLLPLTPQTQGILNAENFARLPAGAAVINLARGGHLVEGDLLAALDSGHLSGAMLDVFQHEPLAPGHPLWSHPKVFITPHVSAQTVTELAQGQVIENIRGIERGEPPHGVVDPDRGY